MVDVFIDGTSDGSSTSDGSLVQNFSVSGSSDGSTIISGNFFLDIFTIGASNGIAATNGLANLDMITFGNSNGNSSFSAFVNFEMFNSGNVNCSSTATGAPFLEYYFSSTSDGSSNSDASVFLTFSESGNSNGVSVISTIDTIMDLSANGISSGAAVVNGSVVYEAILNGTSNGASLAQATANLFMFFGGTSDGSSTFEGNPADGILDIIHFVNGIAEGASTADLEVDIFNVLPFLNLVKSQIVYASPKQIVKFVFEVRNALGQRTDSSTPPIVIQIFDPSINKLSGYPQLMEQLDIGLYTFSLTMPIGPDNLGDFIVDVGWTNPTTDIFNQTFYQIISRMSPSRGGGYIISVQ